MCSVWTLPEAYGSSLTATRLQGQQPIISAQTFSAVGAHAREASSINGPSVIRIPDWIPPAQRAHPDAVYYLYFAHHKGRYIRLAWAQHLSGPWRLYNAGAAVSEGQRGVLDIGDDKRLKPSDTLLIKGHIASPDVHVDHDEKHLVMYFHAHVKFDRAKKGAQKTLVATSQDGLDFSQDIKPAILGPSYFRVFKHRGQLYALTMEGLFTSPNKDHPWTVPPGARPGDNLWIKKHVNFFVGTPGIRPASDPVSQDARTGRPGVRVRHLGLYLSNGILNIFYTAKGHSPERIFLTSVDLTRDDWQESTPVQAPVEILRPEYPWEGSTAPLVPSGKGIAHGLVNQLRDPYVFEDEGRLYLFYAGGGEQAIGMAHLVPAGS